MTNGEGERLPVSSLGLRAFVPDYIGIIRAFFILDCGLAAHRDRPAR